jgi:NitT/TauT family transport system ATP-binding protein
VDEAAYLAERAIVFSKRPARIMTDRSLELPRERTLALRTEPDFAREARALRAALEEGDA